MSFTVGIKYYEDVLQLFHFYQNIFIISNQNSNIYLI